jgi:hypothetical protein
MSLSFDPFPPTKAIPPTYSITNPYEVQYDPNIHLSIEPPKMMMLIDNNKLVEHVGYCPIPENSNSKLAYTEPFRFLSDEGVKVLRQIIDENMQHAKSFGNNRVPNSLRGLGYRSNFVRDLNKCPIANAMLSKMSGLPLREHSYATSWSHVNIGVLPKLGEKNPPVDQWHIDSVPFVLVILMSDMSEAEGGQLELCKRQPFEDAFELIRNTNNNVPEEELLRVSYPGPGHAIFMQGSKFVHHVTPVKWAKEPRITVVNSYQSSLPDTPDVTRYSIFKNETLTAPYEFARHRAMIARNRLNAFIFKEEWPVDKDKLAHELDTIGNILIDGSDILLDKRDDGIPFIKEF